MEIKGLCGTCVYVTTCVFVKDSPVWQCEEFSDVGRRSEKPAGLKRDKREKVVCREAATESE
jgi:hypothetical protein